MPKKDNLQLIPKVLQNDKKRYTERIVVGSSVLFAFDKLVKKILEESKIPLPSSLGSMVLAFVIFKVAEEWKGENRAEAVQVAESLRPAVLFLGNWMPLWLVPPLVVLPNSLGDVKGAKAWVQLGSVHFLGWLVGVVSTAAVAQAIQSGTTTAGGGAPPATTASASAGHHNQHHHQQQRAGCPMSKPSPACTPATPPAPAPPASNKAADTQQRLRRAWSVLTAISYVLLPVAGRQPATFCSTILTLLWGKALPPKISQVLHPLITAGALTSGVTTSLGALDAMSQKDSLQEYFRNTGFTGMGSGDAFFSLLSCSCTALGLRMFYARNTLQENLPTLLGSTAFSSMLSLFGTAAAAGALGMDDKLALMLTQRSVSTPLGLAGARDLGASPALTVASILITGLYGASLGKSLLSTLGFGVEKAVSRGAAMGANSHAIGTASLMQDEPKAAAISSVALALAGVIHSVVCSLPAAQATLKTMVAK